MKCVCSGVGVREGVRGEGAVFAILMTLLGLGVLGLLAYLFCWGF